MPSERRAVAAKGSIGRYETPPDVLRDGRSGAFPTVRGFDRQSTPSPEMLLLLSLGEGHRIQYDLAGG